MRQRSGALLAFWSAPVPGNDTVSGGAGEDAPLVGDHIAFCGTVNGGSGNDLLEGHDGNDDPHGDINLPWNKSAPPADF